MGKLDQGKWEGPSRRQFIAGGSALLALGTGTLAGHAAETSVRGVKPSLQGKAGNANAGNALYGGATIPAHASARHWRAFWITSPAAPRKTECILRFRKDLELDARPSRFLIHVSADNRYLLKVNGKYVGTGPSHSDVQHWKYTTYDIADSLESGKNLISATVWNFAEHAPVRQISDRIGFLLDGDEENPVEIHTDDSWDVAVEKGLSALAMPKFPQHLYYAASPPERLDAGVLRWEWDEPHAKADEQNGWHGAELIGRAASRGVNAGETAWQLTHDGLPLMERREEAAGKVVRVTGLGSADRSPGGPVTIPAHQQAAILIDRGHLTTAYPELAFSRGRGAEIKLTYAEALYDAEGRKGNRNDIQGKHIEGVYDLIYPDGSLRRKFTPLDWRTWRYLQVDVKTGDEPLNLQALRGWFTAFPFVKQARFDSDDALLGSIMEVGYRTARLCAHDTYMDTPYWERLQYVGDTRIQALISYAMTGDNRLPREAIEAFHHSAISEGITRSRYPASEFQVIPGFSLFWIGMVHDFWMYNNDAEFVRSQLPLVRSTLSWFAERQNENGLMGRLPWWPFVDWANGFERGVPPQDAHGDSAIMSLQFVEALRYAAEMERALGLDDLAQRDTGQADYICSAVMKLCWSRQYGLLADTPEKQHFSQHANAFGVWLDVIPRGEQKRVMNTILSANNRGFTGGKVPPHLSLASYYFRFYLARALVHAGLGDRYLETLGPWKQMLAEGLTTWAEMPPPSRSDSHAWSAHPNYDLLTTVAGIRPALPNFGSVRIEPRPGALQRVQAAMPTPRGLVAVELDLAGAKPNASVTLPDGLDGVFVWKGKEYPLKAGNRKISL
jgi:hypothetical protein